jgi:hypothetical protein
MYPWSAAYEHIHSIMKRQCATWPKPSSCTDAELNDFWLETLDAHAHFVTVLEQPGLDAEAVRGLEWRLAALEETLEELDDEWLRRPYLH